MLNKLANTFSNCSFGIENTGNETNKANETNKSNKFDIKMKFNQDSIKKPMAKNVLNAEIDNDSDENSDILSNNLLNRKIINLPKVNDDFKSKLEQKKSPSDNCDNIHLKRRSWPEEGKSSKVDKDKQYNNEERFTKPKTPIKRYNSDRRDRHSNDDKYNQNNRRFQDKYVSKDKYSHNKGYPSNKFKNGYKDKRNFNDNYRHQPFRNDRNDIRTKRSRSRSRNSPRNRQDERLKYKEEKIDRRENYSNKNERYRSDRSKSGSGRRYDDYKRKRSYESHSEKYNNKRRRISPDRNSGDKNLNRDNILKNNWKNYKNRKDEQKINEKKFKILSNNSINSTKIDEEIKNEYANDNIQELSKDNIENESDLSNYMEASVSSKDNEVMSTNKKDIMNDADSRNNENSQESSKYLAADTSNYIDSSISSMENELVNKMTKDCMNESDPDTEPMLRGNDCDAEDDLSNPIPLVCDIYEVAHFAGDIGDLCNISQKYRNQLAQLISEIDDMQVYIEIQNLLYFNLNLCRGIRFSRREMIFKFDLGILPDKLVLELNEIMTKRGIGIPV